jgi:O-antigen/teichoic acid export membrane protein
MLPIYTRFLTPADYGTLELLGMVVDFVGIIFGLKIGQAIFRFYNTCTNNEERNTVITSALYLILFLQTIAILLLLVFSNYISLIVFGDYSAGRYIMLFSLSLFFQALVELPMTFIRAQQRPWFFVLFSSLKLALQLSLNIYFIVIRNMRVEGVIMSALISGGIIALILCVYTLSITGLKFSGKKAKELAHFSIPIMLSSIISFYITFGDRYFLRIFGGLSEVGIYSLGYKFGFLLSFICIEPFFSIWNTEKYNVLNREDAKETFQQTFLIFSAILILISAGVSVFVKDVLKVMAHVSFWSAYRITPIILISYILHAWVMYSNLGLLIEKKTIEITYGTVLSAIVISIGYITLIPKFGALGAAWSTLIAYATRLSWVNWRAKRIYDMELPWKSALMLIIMLVIAISASKLTPEKILISLLINFAIIICLNISLMTLPILPENFRRSLLELVLKPWKLITVLKGAAGYR